MSAGNHYIMICQRIYHCSRLCDDFVIWILLSVLFLLFLMIGFALSSFSMHIRKQSLEEAYNWQKAHYDVSWFDALEKEASVFTSYDGYTLHTLMLRNPIPSDRYVLISHGYTDNHLGSLKYTKMYLDAGFNVLLYDLRGHGQNADTFCTYSIRESKDLAALIADFRRHYGPDVTLGIHGESLGAASSIACLKDHPKIQFVVADCAFSEILSVMKNGLRKMHIPTWFVYIASLCTKIRYGVSYQEMRPIDSLKGSAVPILFIHGEKDDFIPSEHSRRMHEAVSATSELHIIPNAGHAASVLTAPDTYREVLYAFLNHTLN